MYLISAYFDETTNRKVDRWTRQIAEKTGNRFMTDNQVPPHLTISSIEARNGEVLIPKFDELAEKTKAGEIQFVSVGMMLPYVIYGTPVLNAYLHHLSQTIYDTVKDIPETSISKYYRPFQWLPHMTLGKTLDQNQMRIAMEYLQKNFVPFKAQVVELGLAATNPHRDIKRIQL